jgi:hypothetical protein
VLWPDRPSSRTNQLRVAAAGSLQASLDNSLVLVQHSTLGAVEVRVIADRLSGTGECCPFEGYFLPTAGGRCYLGRGV